MLRASTSDDESSNLSAASNVGMWSNGLGHKATNLEIRVQFSASPPQFGSRGLTHDDASVLTKRSGLDSLREFQMGRQPQERCRLRQVDAHRWLERGSHRIHPCAGAGDVGELKNVLGGPRSLALHEFDSKDSVPKS